MYNIECSYKNNGVYKFEVSDKDTGNLVYVKMCLIREDAINLYDEQGYDVINKKDYKPNYSKDNNVINFNFEEVYKSVKLPKYVESEFCFDKNGNEILNKCLTMNDTVERTYDENNNLTSYIRNVNGYITKIDYEYNYNNDLISEKRYDNGDETYIDEYLYNEDNEITRYNRYINGKVAYHIDHIYTKEGEYDVCTYNMTHDLVGDNKTIIEKYDKNDLLISSYEVGNSGSMVEYEYNDRGDVTKKTTLGFIYEYEYDYSLPNKFTKSYIKITDKLTNNYFEIITQRLHDKLLYTYPEPHGLSASDIPPGSVPDILLHTGVYVTLDDKYRPIEYEDGYGDIERIFYATIDL
jgi:hypothetical protein